MALQFKCRSCSEEGVMYLPGRGYHVCIEHAPIDERQVPAYSGFEPLRLLEALQQGEGGS